MSTEFVEHVQKSTGLSLQVPAKPEDEQWRYDVKRARMRQLKTRLHAELAAREDPDDVRMLMTAIEWGHRMGHTSVAYFDRAYARASRGECVIARIVGLAD